MIVAAFLCVSALASSTPASDDVVVQTLKDGTTLVYAHVPGRDVSVRYVVRAGGEDDPPGKAGLAHILEHLVFHGTYDEPEGVFFERAWGASAYLNAFTTDLTTVFVLDAPSSSFATLTPSFLAMVTSPALPFAQFDREKGVVGAEASGRTDLVDAEYAVDQLVFPAANAGATVIGTDKSRDAISIDDVEAFFAQHYVPLNSAVIVAGDVSLDDARAVVEKGLREPPGVADVRVRGQAEDPNVPSEAKALSFVTITAQAHIVDGAKPGACEAAAGILEMRLRRVVLAEHGLAAQIGADCHRERGHDFLVVYAATTSPESSQLPDWIKQVTETSAHIPPSAEERALVERRRRVSIDFMKARANTFANALAFFIGRSEEAFDVAANKIAKPVALSWSGATQVLSTVADEKKTAKIHFSRFESE